MKDEFEKQLSNFFSKYPLRKYRKGESILKSGEVPNFIGYLKSGYIGADIVSISKHKFSTPFFKSILYFTAIWKLFE